MKDKITRKEWEYEHWIDEETEEDLNEEE